MKRYSDPGIVGGEKVLVAAWAVLLASMIVPWLM